MCPLWTMPKYAPVICCQIVVWTGYAAIDLFIEGHIFCHWFLFKFDEHVSSHTLSAFKVISKIVWCSIFEGMRLLGIFTLLFIKVRSGIPNKR